MLWMGDLPRYLQVNPINPLRPLANTKIKKLSKIIIRFSLGYLWKYAKQRWKSFPRRRENWIGETDAHVLTKLISGQALCDLSCRKQTTFKFLEQKKVRETESQSALSFELLITSLRMLQWRWRGNWFPSKLRDMESNIIFSVASHERSFGFSKRGRRGWV